MKYEGEVRIPTRTYGYVNGNVKGETKEEIESQLRFWEEIGEKVSNNKYRPVDEFPKTVIEKGVK